MICVIKDTSVEHACAATGVYHTCMQLCNLIFVISLLTVQRGGIASVNVKISSLSLSFFFSILVGISTSVFIELFLQV